MAGSPMDELARWLSETVSVPATDAYTCAQMLFDDGCRSKEDVRMLVEADALSPGIPVVMRLKIKRAATAWSAPKMPWMR